MKIIHAADLHLGSRLSSLPVGEIRDKRKNEILKSFRNLIDYAKDNDVHVIMLSGDVFDSNAPFKKDKEFFYKAIEANKDITFLYLRGNHDTEESLEKSFPNLKTFSTETWSTYDFDNISISGIELSSLNKSSLYSSLSLDKDKFNIVMMHGDINSKGKDYIDIKKLVKKNIDYLALGHIHQYGEYVIDSRGIAIYPGCLDGRGFDELGEKGFVVLDIKDNKLEHRFISFSSRMILEKEIDISSASSLYEAQELVRKELKDISKESLIKVILNGRVNFDISTIEKDIHDFIKDGFFYVKVESKLRFAIDINSYKNDFSLKGEFVRQVSSNTEYSEEEKELILNIGIKLLNGEEVK